MKKTFLHFGTGLLLACASLYAQPDFKFTPTSFVGALSADAEADWTSGWVEWDPKNAVYPAVTNTTTLNSFAQNPSSGRLEITSNLTLDASQVYLLRGLVIVRSGATLTIPAGTIIRGEANKDQGNFGSLIIDRGAKLIAEGTKENPIVFTSNEPIGDREPGDWAGILICGKASLNKPKTTGRTGRQMEGFDAISAFPGEGLFGGYADEPNFQIDDNDNSGILKYVRIEFAGLDFSQDRELNSLTMGAVGRETIISHVQTSWGNDDAFEAFGGTVNMDHLVSIATTDDDFDFDFGHRGLVQFGIAIREATRFDRASGGSSELFELDSDAATTTPTSNTIFSNITAVGVVPIGTAWSSLPADVQDKFNFGIRIRSNSTYSIINSIFIGHKNHVRIETTNSIDNSYKFSGARASAPVLIQNNIFHGVSNAQPAGTGRNGLVNANPATDLNDFDAWVRAEAGANRVDPVTWATGTLLVNPTLTGTPNFRPVAESPALTGASFAGNRLSSVTPISEININNNQVIYPNPVQRGSEINFGVDVKRFTITNTSGVVLMSGAATSKVSTSTLEAGMYLINVDGKTSKLVVY